MWKRSSCGQALLLAALATRAAGSLWGGRDHYGDVAQTNFEGRECSASFGSSLLQSARGLGRHSLAAESDLGATGSVCVVTRDGCQDLPLEAEEHLSPELAHGVRLVVTRYMEDVTWLDYFGDFRTVVYNKGPHDALMPKPRSNLKIVDVENEGREDDTMLRYISDHYDDLPEATVFLQGWPYDHCSQLASTLTEALTLAHNKLETLSDVLLPVAENFVEFSLSQGLMGLATQLVKTHLLSENLLQRYNLEQKNAHWLFAAVCEEVLGKPCADNMWVAQGAQWIVGRNRIRKTPLEFYRKVIGMPEGFQDEYRGIVLEALWPFLWGEPAFHPSELVPSPHLAYSDSQGLASGKMTFEQGQYCTPRHGIDELAQQMPLRSCAHEVGFCELHWHLTGIKPSWWYRNNLRGAYLLEETAVAANWTLVTKLAVALKGMTSYVQALEDDAVGVSTSEIGPSQWRVSAVDSRFPEKVYLQERDGARYLGCGASVPGGNASIRSASLLTDATTWSLYFFENTTHKVSIQSQDGLVLCTSHSSYVNASSSQISLICAPQSLCPHNEADKESITTVAAFRFLPLLRSS